MVSNRRRPRNRKLIAERALAKVDIPSQDRVVEKRVPATIKWAEVKNIERDDVEVIGEAVIYDDGTYDVVISQDISEEAKVLTYGVTGGVDNLSIDQED